MKKYIILLIFSHLIFLMACNDHDNESISLEVTPDKNEYNVGDTVRFQISGNSDIISFFSGENGKIYENINRVEEPGISKLQFTSLRSNGNQLESLKLMISDDFKGIGTDSLTTLNNISIANWSDITGRASLSSGTSTLSGVIDLSDFATSGKPVFIAFKYSAVSGSIQNKWTISGLTVTNTLSDGSIYTIANLTSTAITNYGNSSTISPGWVAYKVKNNYNWVITSGTSLVVTGATTIATSTSDAEAWAFAGPINLNRVTPDVGVPIKGMASKIAKYTYIYTKAGEYNVSFIGRKSTIYGESQVEKKIKLTLN